MRDDEISSVSWTIGVIAALVCFIIFAKATWCWNHVPADMLNNSVAWVEGNYTYVTITNTTDITLHGFKVRAETYASNGSVVSSDLEEMTDINVAPGEKCTIEIYLWGKGDISVKAGATDIWCLR